MKNKWNKRLHTPSKLGSILLHEGGERGERGGKGKRVKVQIEERNSNLYRSEETTG